MSFGGKVRRVEKKKLKELILIGTILGAVWGIITLIPLFLGVGIDTYNPPVKDKILFAPVYIFLVVVVDIFRYMGLNSMSDTSQIITLFFGVPIIGSILGTLLGLIVSILLNMVKKM